MNTAKHALSATCYLHSKCSMIKRLKQLPSHDPDAKMLKWLTMGDQFTKRADGQAHMRAYLGLQFCFYYVYEYDLNQYIFYGHTFQYVYIANINHINMYSIKFSRDNGHES